jgi:hypothetical protein
MMRKIFLIAVTLVLAAGLALADSKKAPPKVASGTVKAVSADSLKILQGAQEFEFVLDQQTQVIAKGAGRKSRAAKQAGQGVAITDLVKEDQRVMVRYHEVEGKFHAAEVRVL